MSTEVTAVPFLQNNKIELVDDHYYFECPHCNTMTQIKSNEVNCGIFRHGVYKRSGTNIPPHATKETCEKLIRDDKIYGCGKPFKFNRTSVTICDYI